MVAISADSRTTRSIDAGNKCFRQVPPSTDRATPSDFYTIALPHVRSRLLAARVQDDVYVDCCVRSRSFIRRATTQLLKKTPDSTLPCG